MVMKVTLEEELKKNEDLKKEDLNNLKEWYLKQAHLPPIPDELLVVFFHSCYFKMEATKVTIDNYFTVRTHVPEFFSDRDPYKIKLKNGKPIVNYFMLPSNDGRRIICCRLTNLDPADYVFNEAVKAFAMTIDLDLRLHGTFPGLVIVIDMEGAKFGHLARVSPLAMKKFLYYLQEALPVRLAGMHFINVVSFMDSVMALMRPFMKKELTEMLHIHSEGMHSLHKHIPKSVLPSEYGGDCKSVVEYVEPSLKILKENKKYFEEEGALRVVESKRAGKAKNAGDIFGVEGSFKKLDLD